MKVGQRISFFIVGAASLVLIGAFIVAENRKVDLLEGTPFEKNLSGERIAFENQGKKYLKQGNLEQALVYFEKANDPKLSKFEWSADFAKGMMSQIYLYQGKYDKALEMLQGHIATNPEKYEHNILEILALKEYQKTGSKEAIYEHLDYMFKNYPNSLPPGGADFYRMQKIFHLYDVVGDHDAAIRMIDSAIDYLYKIFSQQDNAYEYKIVESTREIDRLLSSPDENGKYLGNDPKRGYRLLRKYFLVREAFEKDKAEGTTGRPTKVIIRI